MTHRLVYICFCLFFFGAVSGCMHTGKQSVRKNEQRYKIPSSIPYQLKAMALEERKAYSMSLVYWQIAEKLIQEKVTKVAENTARNCEVHFKSGVSFFEQGKMAQARGQFIRALIANPSHGPSLLYLKKKLTPARTIAYKVADGDTARTIAAGVYKDEKYDFLVRYFADTSALTAGETVMLPVLDTKISSTMFSLDKALLKARKLFREEAYEKLVPIAENIHQHTPESEESSFLMNSAYCGLGDRLAHNQMFDKAIRYYQKVDPAFKDVSQTIAEIKKRKQNREKKERAMSHSKCLSRGISLYEQKHYFQALDVLNTVDLAYQGVDKLKETIIKDMKDIAEQYYKKGVKLFIEEDLIGAIGQWKLTLKYDPDHTKAPRDIENARQILKKINEIETNP